VGGSLECNSHNCLQSSILRTTKLWLATNSQPHYTNVLFCASQKRAFSEEPFVTFLRVMLLVVPVVYISSGKETRALFV
jgi:hypothetical protein